MPDAPFSLVFIEELIDKCLAANQWQESKDDGDYAMALTLADGSDQSAGYVRLWVAAEDSALDRMLHMRLIAGPVETQLLFLFGRADSTMPHFHAQAVQFPPEGCVYNADLLPRVDPVENPEWFEQVFGALRRPYRKATHEKTNSCAQAPANPALAVYMSPWGIASAQTDQAELERVKPSIHAYLDHYLELAQTPETWRTDDPAGIRERDARHLELFLADELDPRAWNGVYRIIGEEPGRAMKALLQNPQH